jgi:hypothetical protein
MKRFLAVFAGTLILAGATATAAGAKTIHLFSKNVESALFDPNDDPITDPNAEPPVGSYFIGVDNVYKGNHRKHSRKRVGSDHIICTVLEPATASVVCDALIALRGGVIISDRQRLSFATQTTVFKITSGTGKYRNAKGGTVTATDLGENSEDSDLVVRF